MAPVRFIYFDLGNVLLKFSVRRLLHQTAELLEIDDAMRDAIHRRASSGELEEIARRHGMVTLGEDGMKKVAARVTTASEVLRSAGNASEGAGNGGK